MDRGQILKELKTLKREGKLSLSAADIPLEKLTACWQDIMPGVEPLRFADILGNNLPGFRIEPLSIGKQDLLSFRLCVPSSGLRMQILLTKVQGTHYFSLWDVERTGRRDHGHMRCLLNNLVSFCDASLVLRDIRLTAENVGSYAWAKFGFVPEVDDWSNADVRTDLSREMLARLVECKTHISPSTYSRVATLLESKDPKTVWTIADLREPRVPTPSCIKHLLSGDEIDEISLGKALLIGQVWTGKLSLEDHNARRKFETYIQSGPLERAVSTVAGADSCLQKK